MKRILLLFVAAFLMLQVQAQKRYGTYEEVKTGKYPYVRYEGDPLKSRWYTLPNGLTVVLSENKGSPRVYTMIATKAGSKNDPADNTGLAHYLEHLLFKGTDKYGTQDYAKEKVYLDQIDALYEQYNHSTDSTARRNIYRAIDSISGLAAKYSIANEYDKMLQSMGAEGTNAFTSFEQTVYVNDIPANQLHRWAEVEAERFRNPVLRLFHTELEAVYEEKNISLDNDGRKVYESLLASLFRKHTYGTQTTIGTVDDLKNPSLNKIREYYHTWYVPNNMAVIMSGDFNPDEVIDIIASHFDYMKPKAVPAFSFEPEMIRAKPDVVNITGPDAENVTIGFRLPGVGTRESNLLRLCDLLMSNATSGLIDLDLVKKQKVLSASSSPMLLKDYSVFTLSGRPREGQTLEEVKDLLMAELSKLKSGDFDEKMINAIVLNNDLDQIRGYEDNAGRCYSLLDAFVTGQKWINYLNTNYEMSRFTKEEIVRFANEWFTDGYTVIYKRKGENDNKVKIIKPEIHPVDLNRDKTSAFVSEILEEKTDTIRPVFIDFNKDIVRKKVNNVELMYSVNPDNRIFTLYYLFDIGRYNDLKLPFAINYFQFLGSGNMSNEELSKKFYSLGCNYGINAGDKESYLYLSGPEENFNEALKLFEGWMSNPTPDQKVLDDLVKRTLKSREDNKLNKRSIGSALRSYAIYGKDNPFRYQLSADQLKALKPEELVTYIRNLNSYPHRILYNGQRDAEGVVSTLTELHKTPAKFREIPKRKTFIKQDVNENKVYFTHYEMVQAEIFWNRKGPVYSTGQAAVQSLFNEYFGGGMSSVVFQNIREAKALAYSTYAAYSNPEEKGENDQIIAYVGTQSDKLQDAIASMNDLLNNLPETKEAFEQAKVAIVNRIETERIRKTDLLFTVLAAEKKGQTTDIRSSIYEKVSTLSFSDIQKFHKEQLASKPYFYTIVASKDKVSAESLKKYGKVEILSLEDIFGY